MGIQIEDEFFIFKDDDHFTKNPDVVQLPDGRLLCVFCLDDRHWAQEYAKITLIESRDEGKNWGNARTISESYPVKGDERWVTPRISRLSDGRLVIICDQDDNSHCHEDQPPGIYAWWSEDEGETWEGPQATGIPGIEPDRIRELEDGTLIAGSHYMFKETGKLGQVVTHSFDGGETWEGPSVVASDPVHNYCEGAIVPLQSGKLACIMRENNHNNYPSYISFSHDKGRTWSPPVRAPFSGDRPFAEQLPDGRLLVTYRNQGSTPGTCAWLGEVEQESGYKIAKDRGGKSHQVSVGESEAEGTEGEGIDFQNVSLKDENLTIEGAGGIVRYLIYPPDGPHSQVYFRAKLKADGESGEGCGTIQIARLGIQLRIYSDRLELEPGNGVEYVAEADLSNWRELLIEYRSGKVEIYLDGQSLIRDLMYEETLWPARSFFGSDEGQSGRIAFSEIEYGVKNYHDSDYHWYWNGQAGSLPDSYSKKRWVHLEHNTNPSPDNGYSSWVRLPDGRIFVADYTNKEAPAGKAYLKGYYVKIK